MLGFIAKNPSKSGALCGMSGERASGGKKHQHSRCRSCAGSSKSCCPCIQRRLKRASLLWRGSNGAITRPISRIVNAEKRRAKESGVVGLRVVDKCGGVRNIHSMPRQHRGWDAQEPCMLCSCTSESKNVVAFICMRANNRHVDPQ